jgi:hypothetical protein
MARNIFSFVKTPRKRTSLGRISSGIGLASILCLVILLLVSFVRGGEIVRFVPTIGYISFFAAIVSLFISLKLHENTEVYGSMVLASLYISGAAVGLHALIFLIGCFVSVV